MNRLVVSASGFGQTSGTTFSCLVAVSDEQGNAITQLAGMNFVLYSDVNNPLNSNPPTFFTKMKTTAVVDHGGGFYHVEAQAEPQGGAATVPVIPPPRGPVGLTVTQYEIEASGPVGIGPGRGGNIQLVPIASGLIAFTAS